MKALRVEEYGPPENLVLREMEEPVPGMGEVLVEIRAAGVNPVDTYHRSGTRGYKPPLPFTPGTDGAGEIVACGEGCKAFQPGDRVYLFGSLSGTYAERCLCRESHVFPLPAGLDWNQAASLGVPYFSALRALFTRGNLNDEDTVLIHGASGSVGLAALQMAAGRKGRLFGSASSAEGREVVLKNGADYCFNHLEAGHYAEIMDLTQNRGIDLALEMCAGRNLQKDLEIIAAGGRIVIVGSGQEVQIEPRELLVKEVDCLGMMIRGSSEDELRQYAVQLEMGVAEKRIQPVISNVYSVQNAPEAHREIMESKHKGSIVIVFQV